MNRNDVYQALLRNAQSVVPAVDPATVDPDQTLTDLGCNSIDRAEIVTLTLEELQVVVPVQEFTQGHSLNTLVDTMLKHA